MEELKNHPVIRQYIEWNAFGDLLGMSFTIPAKGSVVYAMKITEMHLATPVAAHGGSIAALMDAALGVACLSKVCEEGRIVSTVSLSIQYLGPALLGDLLTATAHVIKAGNRLLFVEAKITNQHNEIIALASATMNAYPMEKVRR